MQENVSLLPFNTFGIDVKAKLFSEFSTEKELFDLIELNKTKKETILILGGGSNVLFTKNLDLWVWKNNLKGIELISDQNDYVILKVGAGEVWHNLVSYCVEKNFGGIENLSLIPGCVGAGPMQNIGAYGVELKDVCVEVECMDRETGQKIKFSSIECEFGYRESIFKNKVKDKYVITHVHFKLSKNAKVNTQYGSIKDELAIMGIENPSIKDVSEAVINIRKSKLPDPALLGNAGSFFKNPVIDEQEFKRIEALFPTIVSYPSGNGKIKLAAGWLIEQCGLKGFRDKDAGIHQKQALVIVNYGKSTGKELWDLSEKVIAAVKNKFGVELEREVNIY